MDSNELIRETYDQVAPSYDQDEADQVLRRRLYWFVYESLTWNAVAAVLPEGRSLRILDAGGGSGKYGALFAERGHHVTVLDLSPGMLEQAKARFAQRGLLPRAAFEVGTIVSLPFADGAFDLVFCEGDPVSYCTSQYREAIAELCRVAAPGAYVVLGVDNRQSYFLGALESGKKAEAMDILLTGRATCPYGLPVHAFTLRELEDAVDAAGAEVVEIFGKPILFREMLEALGAARGSGFDPWEARQEFLALQERIAHEGYTTAGGHLQVMARRR
ncbi:class I SAM-dependent methyltransferase [Polyangium sorediatum]|uniref:Class I SAM-dependent methyltransferase n=1 Tax=Polyangium sorediatum TaxID=889274 RepID=A0ABT6P1Y8_9BACT|nr:class I SAM-dependent methyltransferase [Polyangium sorediatum]MDI1434593.1 class I SAM-dependent methyltransferase [Polyangium sorediatum]